MRKQAQFRRTAVTIIIERVGKNLLWRGKPSLVVYFVGAGHVGVYLCGDVFAASVHDWERSAWRGLPVAANQVGVVCLESESTRVCQSALSRWFERLRLSPVVLLVLREPARGRALLWFELA
jgi:hypothetical protein